MIVIFKKRELVNVHKFSQDIVSPPVEGFFTRLAILSAMWCETLTVTPVRSLIVSLILTMRLERFGYTHADMIIDFIETHQLSLEWLIETHVHADHLSAAPYIQQKRGGKIGIAEQIVEVQQGVWQNVQCWH